MGQSFRSTQVGLNTSVMNVPELAIRSSLGQVSSAENRIIMTADLQP
jgi:hypothetical protein